MLKRLQRIGSSVKDRFSGSRKLVMCRKCHSFYYKRSWHFEAPESAESEIEEEVPVRLTQCSACAEFEATLNDRDSELLAYGFSS